MATTFPTTVDSFTTRVNNVDTIDASHVNNLQDSVVAIETLIGDASTRRITWSPALTYSTTVPTSVVYGGSNTGFYWKFGSLVYVSARCDIGSRAGGSGDFRVSLPIATSATANSHNTFSVFANSGFGATAWPSIAITNPNSTYFNLYTYSVTAAGTIISTTTAGTTSGFNFWFSGFYWT